MSAPAVALPSRQNPSEGGTLTIRPPVWSIDHSDAPQPTPLPAKCARHELGREGVCCKELKDEDERTLIDPDVVRDVVIGLSDGLTVPFALTAGLSSLGNSRVVVLGGVAELIAGAISMGIGGFLASQAEGDHYRFQAKHTAARVVRSCAGEMEREVHAILGPVGVDESLSRQVANCLREVEVGSDAGYSSSASSDAESNTKLKFQPSVGLTPFLLKFGEGIEEVPTMRMYTSAFTIGMGYLLGGLIPLLPYFFIQQAHVALMWSCIITGVILLIFGVVKARVTGAAGSGIGGYIWGAVSTLMVGGAAAGAAYAIVAALEGA
ncbi:DUF125-domain-containing protein [Heliocybe sulcata]|uniref:DUF125-domain-containing protein n=1 Tax=Heliocybe sulcata TaxID=5364 RepID=A0A5C3N6B6_9AGAM|nr:DUF125-domain-containing protein [Heliocybe sulcata]